ncbi:MAG: fructosamine kinase family protein [Turneriella sp.]
MHPARESIERIIGRFEIAGRLAGGDIALVQRLHTQNGDYVLKSGTGNGVFASEAYGLMLMAQAGVTVPEVVDHSDSYLLMRYLPPGKADEVTAGKMLGRLHEAPSAGFGLDRDTYLATLLQNNQTSESWADFYLAQRLFPLVAEVNADDLAQWRQFGERVRPLLAACSFPALLHGDLWSGNLYYSATGPVFIDPACYFGDPLVDVAMTRLFGGFAQNFYSAYFDVVGRRDSEADLLRIYQLYPLLVHARLFGGGYYHRACAVRDAYL